MKHPIHLLIAMIMVFVYGCQTKNGEPITEKIIYEVQIKNTDANADWWRDNLPGPARDQLVKRLMDGVKSGEIVACKEDGATLSRHEAANIGTEITSITFQRPEPPYDTYDTIVRSELSYNDITRIRFMEEWYYDAGKNLIRKKLVAMAPVVENYGPDGKFRGYEALFWVFNKE
jgi:hypothetical protein